MQIPSKLVSGMAFRQGVVNKINDIIDYLRSIRIVGDNNSIQVSQCVNGLTIKAIPNYSASKSGELNHPFKLFVSVDEDEKEQISVQAGDLYIQGIDFYKQINFCYDENSEYYDPQYCQPYIPINWKEVDEGEYVVVAVIQDFFDEGGTTADDILTKGVCYIAPYNPYTVPNIPGFTSIPIGIIEKTDVEDEEDEDKYSLSIKEQLVFSDLMIDDFNRYMPWSINFVISVQQKSEECSGLLNPENTKIEWVYCRAGIVYDNSSFTYVVDENGLTIQSEQGDYSNLQDGMYFALLNDKTIVWVKNSETLFDTFNKNNMMLGYFMINSGLIQHWQCINNDLKDEDSGYPFKLYFDYDENDNKVLKIFTGQVFYMSDRFYLLNYEDSLITFDLDDLEDGNYGIIGVAKSVQNNGNYVLTPQIIIVDQNITTNDIPNAQGYRVFTIGSISKETPSENSNSNSSVGEGEQQQPQPLYSVTYQYQMGNLILEDKYYDLPFTSMVIIDDGDSEDVKTNRSDWVLDDVINHGGKILDSINQAQETLDENAASDDSAVPASNGSTWCYIERTYNNLTSEYEYQKKFTTTNPASTLFVKNSNTGQLETEKLVVSKVTYGTYIIIQNYHASNFYFPIQDTYKVKVADDNNNLFSHRDYVPQYLDDKIKTDRAENYASATWPTASGTPKSGYIYKCAYDGASAGAPSYMFLRWDYPGITNYDGTKYLTLNCLATNGLPTWEPQGKIRLADSDTTADFIPNLVQSDLPLTITTSNNKLKWSLNNFDYIQDVVQGDCVTIQKSSASAGSGSTLAGTIATINVDSSCVLGHLAITGTTPIAVSSSSGASNSTINYNISFNDTYVKSISAGTCISATTNNGVATIGVDKTCIFQNFSITGTAPISVTGSGESWAISFNDTYVKSITGGTCINASTASGVATISVDKTCVFQNFSITGTAPISVTGSGESWAISFNGTYVKSITAGTCATVSTSNGVATVGVDASCVLGNLNITGTDGITVSGSGANWTIGYTPSSSSSSGSTSTISVVGTAPISVSSASGASGSTVATVALNYASSDSITLSLDGNNLTADVNIGWFHSSDGSITIQSYGGNGIDLLNADMVSVDVNDSPGYLYQKILIDSSISSLLTIQNTGSALKIASALQGSGILLCNNGTITPLAIPNGNAVLVASNGTLSWIPYSDCANACQ